MLAAVEARADPAEEDERRELSALLAELRSSRNVISKQSERISQLNAELALLSTTTASTFFTSAACP